MTTDPPVSDRLDYTQRISYILFCISFATTTGGIGCGYLQMYIMANSTRNWFVYVSRHRLQLVCSDVLVSATQ